jgi:type IV secretory pathway TrbD component
VSRHPIHRGATEREALLGALVRAVVACLILAMVAATLATLVREWAAALP